MNNYNRSKRAFYRNQYPFMIKNKQKTKDKKKKKPQQTWKRNFFILIKNIYKILAAKMILNGEKWSAFSLILGTKQVFVLITSI